MNKQLTTPKKSTLPSLADLYADKEAVNKQNALNLILNAPPKPEWVKKHPFVNNLVYLPIERVEYLLTMIFSKWWVEVKETKLLANSITVTVKLWVLDPLTGEEMWQDGVGAIPIQIAKGEGALNFDKMNSSAVQIGLPAAESFAIKDAAEKFGRIFGKDLNRKNNINYSDRLLEAIGASEIMNNPTITEEIRQEVLACENKIQLNAVFKKYEGYGDPFHKLVTAHSKFLESLAKEEGNEVKDAG